MDQYRKEVEAFRSRFNLPIKYNPCANIGSDEINLNVMLMFEELTEYRDAANSGDKEKVMREVCDMMVVLYGIILSHGLQHKFPRCFNAVMESNMTKVDQFGQHSFDSDGKLIKNECYVSPDENILSIMKDRNY